MEDCVRDVDLIAQRLESLSDALDADAPLLNAAGIDVDFVQQRLLALLVAFQDSFGIGRRMALGNNQFFRFVARAAAV